MRIINFFTILVLIGLTVLAGCSASHKNRGNQVSYFEHVVSYQGETLGLISKWYTGRTENWRVILDHNPQIDVYKIKPGDFVRIPEYLVTRTESMPQQYVAKSQSMRAVSAENSNAAIEQGAPSASGSLAPQIPTPPEKSLPEAGLDNGASDSAPSGDPATSDTREELLNELLTE